MNTIIIEDEYLAAERLKLLLQQYDPSIKVQACLESIEETIAWIGSKPLPDFFLMDIHLADGYCFDIFRHSSITKPVIFTTAYNEHALEAFKYFSIDYILKPVTLEALSAAINKYKTMAQAFVIPDYSKWVDLFRENSEKYKDRFLAKLGSRTFFVQAVDIACFIADNKIVQLVDNKNNRLHVSYSLEKLEQALDPHYFFRINRKFIVHSRFIDQIKSYSTNRLKITLKGIQLNEEIIVSREKVPEFRKWAES